jgi:hypothetical protein
MAAAAAKRDDEINRDHLLSVVAGSPMVRKELQALADANATARQALFSELSTLDTDGAAEHGTYETQIASARAAIAVVEARMRDAIQAAVKIQNAHDQARFSRDARRGAIQTELKSAASPIISEFATWLLDEQDRCCRMPIEALQIGEAKNPITGRRSSSRVITNKISIDNRLAAVRDALRQIDDLKLLPDQREIPARIVEIKNALPKVEPPKAPEKEANNE